MNRKFLVRALVVLAGLLFLSASTVFSQGLCDSYFDKYRVCVETGAAGSNVDYDDCGTYTDETACENAGCYWNTQGLPTGVGACTVDVCIADTNFDGRITGGDLTALKKELARLDCPTTPSNPGLLGALVPKTGQTKCYDADGVEIDL